MQAVQAESKKDGNTSPAFAKQFFSWFGRGFHQSIFLQRNLPFLIASSHWNIVKINTLQYFLVPKLESKIYTANINA